MATENLSRPKKQERLPPLENGDRLDQKTFHARYEAMPPHVRAELIGGVVYMASPQKPPHGKSEFRLVRWLDEYVEATPGTEAMWPHHDHTWAGERTAGGWLLVHLAGMRRSDLGGRGR